MVPDAAYITIGFIRYGSRIKECNPGNGVVPFLTHRCSGY